MANKSELFRQQSLELGEEIFKVKAIRKYIKELKRFVRFLGLPEKYTDFKQIKQVSNDDIKFLINHFNEVDSAGKQIAIDVYNKIPK